MASKPFDNYDFDFDGMETFADFEDYWTFDADNPTDVWECEQEEYGSWTSNPDHIPGFFEVVVESHHIFYANEHDARKDADLNHLDYATLADKRWAMRELRKDEEYREAERARERQRYQDNIESERERKRRNTAASRARKKAAMA